MNETVEQMLSSLHAMRKQILTECDSVSNNELLQLAVDVHGLKKFISEFYSEISDIVVDKVNSLESPVVVDGGTVEIKRGTPRKSWDHEALISKVSKHVIDMSVDMGTGEVVASPREMIQNAFKCAGVSYWKIGELKNLNIDASDYCEVSEPVTNLVIRRNS